MRILYFYSWQHFTTGSPKMLATTVELVDRARHQPLFLATADGPLVTALAGVLLLRSLSVANGNVIGGVVGGVVGAVAASIALKKRRPRD